MRRADWVLGVPIIRWAYRAMCKKLSMEMISKLRSKVGTIILEERNPHAIAPTVGIVHKDQDEGITYMRVNICGFRKPFGEGTLNFTQSKKSGYD